MKKYIVLLMLAAMAVPACNDALELRDNGTTDMTQVFADKNKTAGYLNSCYNYIIGLNSLRAGSFTDDAQDAQALNAGSQYDFWYNQTLNASNFGSYNYDGDPWTTLYQGVRKCNVFLDNIATAAPDLSDQKRTAFTAQAKVLRALYYMNLVKRYGAVPLITTDLGTTHDYSTDVRTPVKEVLEQIIKDCDEAIAAPNTEDFSYVPANSAQYNMMTKAVAQALRVEAAAYAVSPLFADCGFDPQTALTVAADGLAKLLSNGFALFTATSATYPTAYQNYFMYNGNDLHSVDKETIYGVNQVAVWTNCGVPIVAGTSTAGSCPTQELVDAYEMANGQPAITGYSDASHLQPIVNTASGYDATKPYVGRDPRFYATIFYNGSKRGSTYVNTYVGGTCGISETNVRYTCTGYYMRKYASDASNRNTNQDGYIRSMRLAEVYMNFAEVAMTVSGAYTKVSGAGMSAADAVNAIRSRAGMPDLPGNLTSDQFVTRYRNERRIEFALEADRFFSLRRWKVLGNFAKQVTGLRINGTTYERFAFDARQTAEDKYCLYPINTTEANKIQKLTGTSWQNPGW